MNVIYRQINEQEIKDIPERVRIVPKAVHLEAPRRAAGPEGSVGPAPRVLDAAHRSDVDGRASCC